MVGRRCFLGVGWLPWVLLAFAPAPAAAEPLRAEQVPPELKPWIPWVLRGHERALCPRFPGDDSPRCVWAGALDLALEAGGGRFQQTWEVYAETSVPLPGGRDRWPLAVLVAGRPATVLEEGGQPRVRLPPGRHSVSGSFGWKRLPESLPVPAETGLVALRLGGQPVAFPRRQDGELFLEATTRPEAAADRLDLTVHRKVTDGVPLILATRLQLAVAGKMREVLLGQALPPGFVPHALHSPLPARLESGGRLRLQLRPGSFTVTLEARQESPARALTRPAPEGTWTEGDEVWVWQAQPALRVVTVAGAPAVDPRQTTLPREWRSLPAYLMKPGATLALQERRRGDADPAPDQLTLDRQLWLDFDGGGYTARDAIRGRLGRGWRLEMGPESQLGRVAVAGTDQFITRLADGGKSGVEIRQRQVNLEAESRLEGARQRLPAVGWAHDFQAAAATLNLPPGWRLIHAAGADRVDRSWIKRWTLLDLFLVLVVAISVARLFGRGPGFLALLMMLLIAQERDAPAWIWLAVVLGEALVRALPAGQLRKLAKLYRLGAAIVLILVAIPFAVGQIRGALYPGLAGGGGGFLSDLAPAPMEDGALVEPQAEGALSDGADRAEMAEAVERSALELRALSGSLREEAGAEAGAMEQKLARAPSRVGNSGIGGLRGAGRAAPGAPPVAAAAPTSTRSLGAYDPDAQVQTGPGVPRWRWTQVRLTWNGPVEQSAQLTLWLEPPWVAGLLAFAAVGLVGLLALLLFRSALANLGASFGRWLPGVPVLLLAALLPAGARAAEFPPKELLDQLRDGLLEPPACQPTCASVGRLALEVSPQQLRLRLEASAAVAAPLALPGLAEHWLPAVVLLDGKPSTALLRQGGRLWLRLPPGSHQVVLQGPLDGRQSVQIPLGPARPHAVAATLDGWLLAGVSEDGAVGESLELTRAESASARAAGAPESFQAQSLPPFVTVERTLQLGLDWEVETRVVRATPPGAAVVIEVPLLPGESVVSEGVRVREGRVQVNMGPEEGETTWRSILAQKSPIALAAPATAAWAESWRLDLGPIWHAEVSGIPPVHAGDAAGERRRMWRPWPGETVAIVVTRPPGLAGRTFTIDRSELQLRPGGRSTEGTLTLELRSSRGGEHALTLPEGASLESLQVDGREQPLRLDGRRVTLPLAPGARTFRLGFRSPAALGFFYRTPTVDLGVPSVNADLRVSLAADRWVLLLGGPRLGPAVLVWSVLIVIVAAGLLLGRTTLTPLRARHFILLGLGFVPLSVTAAALVVGYLLALGWRRDRLRIRQAWLHDLTLIVLALWTLVAMGVLFVAVQRGLLASPDMAITGNGSYATELRWYSDRVPGALPVGWVLSLPLMVYHLAMLAWALWLAAALIRWSRWVWSCFAEGGLWRPLRRPPPPAAPGPASPP